MISITRSLDEIHSIYTRQALNKNKPIKSFNTDQFGKRSLRYFGATLWNRISVEIKESHSLTTFMKKLKNYKIDSYSSFVWCHYFPTWNATVCPQLVFNTTSWTSNLERTGYPLVSTIRISCTRPFSFIELLLLFFLYVYTYNSFLLFSTYV